MTENKMDWEQLGLHEIEGSGDTDVQVDHQLEKLLLGEEGNDENRGHGGKSEQSGEGGAIGDYVGEIDSKFRRIGTEHLAHSYFELPNPVPITNIFKLRSLPTPNGFGRIRISKMWDLCIALDVAGQCQDPTTYFDLIETGYPSVNSVKEALAMIADSSDELYSEYAKFCKSKLKLEVIDLPSSDACLDWAALLTEARLPTSKIAAVSETSILKNAEGTVLLKDRSEQQQADERFRRRLSESSAVVIAGKSLLETARRAFGKQRLFSLETRSSSNVIPDLKRVSNHLIYPNSLRYLLVQLPHELSQIASKDQGYHTIMELLDEIRKKTKEAEIIVCPSIKLKSATFREVTSLSLLLSQLSRKGIRTMNVRYGDTSSWSLQVDSYSISTRNCAFVPLGIRNTYWHDLRSAIPSLPEIPIIPLPTIDTHLLNKKEATNHPRSRTDTRNAHTSSTRSPQTPQHRQNKRPASRQQSKQPANKKFRNNKP